MTQEERTLISREQIIEAAMEEFGTHDYNSATINRFCEAHHISKGRLYHHFKDKEEIYQACIRVAYDGLCDALLAFEPDSSLSLVENLHNFFCARQSYFAQNPYTPKVIHEVFSQPLEKMPQELGNSRSRFLAINEEKLLQILESTNLRNDIDPHLIAQAFYTASNAIHFTYGYPNWNPKEDMLSVLKEERSRFDKIVSIFVYGLLPRPDIPGLDA